MVVRMRKRMNRIVLRTELWSDAFRWHDRGRACRTLEGYNVPSRVYVLHVLYVLYVVGDG